MRLMLREMNTIVNVKLLKWNDKTFYISRLHELDEIYLKPEIKMFLKFNKS